MQPALDPFDLVLSYPQWQGSGRPENLLRGASAAADVCAQFGPSVTVSPSDADGDRYGVRRWNAIFDQFCSAQDILAREQPKRVLTAGGDCSVDVPVIDYLNSLYPELTIVWVDTHPDANTAENSLSGRFHGMPVSAIMGYAPEPMRSRLCSPVDPAHFRYFGVRVGDDAEWAFQREHDLRILDPEIGVEGPVHIHFDLDVLEPAEFPYLALGEPGGLSIDDALTLVGGIARQADVVGLTITEFAPADEAGAREGSKFVARLCETVTRQ